MRRFVFILSGILIAVVSSYKFYLRDNAPQSLENKHGSVFLYFSDASRKDVRVSDLHGARREEKLDYCLSPGSNCLLFSLDTELSFKKAEIRLLSDKDTEAEIIFTGPLSERLKEKRIEVDFKNFYLDGEPVFQKTQSSWRRYQIIYGFKIEKEKPVSISFEYRRHIPDYENISWLVLLTVILLAGVIFDRLEKPFFGFFYRLYGKGTVGQKIFLTLFFLILCVPAVRLDHREESVFENRKLAKKPSLVVKTKRGDNGLALEYGKYFDYWFSDRFFGRLEVISFYHALQKSLRFRLKTRTAFVGRDNDIFQIRDLKVFDPAFLKQLERESEKYINVLQKLKKWTDQKNMKLYVVLVPVKESILYDRLGKGMPAQTAAFDQWVGEIKEASGVNIIYPKKEIRQAVLNNRDLIFFKQDHHYTDFGMTFLIRELMKQITHDFPDIPVLSEKDFSVTYDHRIRHGASLSKWQTLSHLCTLLMIFDKEECRSYAKPYRYYRNKNQNVEIDVINNKTTTYFNPEGKYSLYLLGTSHTNQMSVFLPFSFKQVIKEVKADTNITLKNVSRYNPDALIVVLQTTVADRLKDLFKE